METEFMQLNALQEVASRRTDAVLIVDLQTGKLVFSNTQASKLFGTSSDDHLHKLVKLLDQVSPPDREYVKNKYQQVSKTSSVSGIEFRLLDQSGKIIWLSAETVLIDSNRIVFVVVRDITHDKEHENYLVEYGTRKNTVLDTVVHQLSGSLSLMNNLASKAGKLTIAANQPELDAYLSLMRDNSEHCIKIIDDLAKIEYKESPGIHVKPSRFDVVRNISYIFEELKKSDDLRKLSFKSTIPVMFIHTDDFKLLQIINNLVSNALKFTRDGDEIRLRVDDRPDSIIISVQDSGIGIPETLQPFIFQKNGPAGRTGLNGEKSNGLGLSICNHLAQLLGGRIWFDSKEGVGSTFYLELPKT